MSNVLIDRQKIDILANAISDKSGVPVTMTLAEMVDAVDGIETGGGEPNLQAKTYTVDSAGTATVTADSGYDGLSEVEVTVPQGEMYVTEFHDYETVSGVRKWYILPYATIESSDSYGTEGFIADHTTKYGAEVAYNAIPKNTTVTPTESSQTIGGANYMMEGAVTVNAISSNYVGSGITRRDGGDITSAGNAVMIPEGYYDDDWTHYIASGTAGTPTATKGTVSNHQVSVTPSATNTAGYISGGTINGTAVTVSASELVSGTYSVSASGTHDVTNYASASIAVNVPNSYSASDEGKVVSNGALVAQTADTVTQNGTVDTTLINSLTVNVSGSGSNVSSGLVMAYNLLSADDEVDEEDGHGEIHTPGGVGAAHAKRIVRRRGGPELILTHDDDEPAENECQSDQRIHGLLREGRVVHLAELQEVVQDDHVEQAPDDVDGSLWERARSDERIVELPGKVQGQCPEGHAMCFVQVAAMDDQDIRDTPAQSGNDVTDEVKGR